MTGRVDAIGGAHRRLHAAGSIDALLSEVASFLASLPPARITQVPPNCRPRRVATQQDVLHWCQRLQRHRMLGATGTRSTEFRVLHDYFAHAAAKAHFLRPRRDYEPPVVMPRRAVPPGPRPSARPLS